MLKWLPIDLIVEIGILAGPDEYEQLAQTSNRNSIILQKPYIIRATNEFIVKIGLIDRLEFLYRGKFHSFNDQPAVIWTNGTQWWYHHGEIHRDNDRPAIVNYGTQDWVQHGQFHRDNDQPARIFANGCKEWYRHNILYKSTHSHSHSHQG
jgi:hypothetical protein